MPKATSPNDKRLKANRKPRQNEIVRELSPAVKELVRQVGEDLESQPPAQTYAETHTVKGATPHYTVDNNKPIDNGAERPQTITRERPQRPTRSVDVLNAPKREGYVRRFVNDKPGRVQRFIEMGYTIVIRPTETGQQRAGTATPESRTVVSRHVGGNVVAILMEIREDWYHAYKKEDQDKLDAQDTGKGVAALVSENAGASGTDSRGVPMTYGRVEKK